MTIKLSSDPAVIKRVRDYIEMRRSSKDAWLSAVVRVEMEHVEHFHFKGHSSEGGSFSIDIDEPPERGGYGRGPTPLNYFLLGSASCLLMQWAKLALLEGLKIDSLKASVRGYLDRRIEGSFKEIVFDITMTGSESPERMKEFAREAEKLCFVHNTLKNALTLTTNIKMGEETVYSSKTTPTTH